MEMSNSIRSCFRLTKHFSDDAGNRGQRCRKLRGIFTAGFGDLRFAAA
jgi:hypothetical protein